MVVNVNESDTGVIIQQLLEHTSAPTKDVPIYWDGAVVPAPPPDTFILIEPLFPTLWRNWGCVQATHTVQIRAVARSVGGATSLRHDIYNLLPRDVFSSVTFGPRFKTDEHYDAIMTVQTITAPEGA